MTAKQKYELWVEKVTDRELLAQLEAIKDDATQIENLFYRDLAFGTGGMRGELGVGTNCFNIYTVARATTGIANYMLKHGYKRAAVSRDSRINSDIFASVVANIFSHDGITVYVCDDIMPTPFLSYMTRECHADIGVMITASHNPARYNGYKVYGSDGCQLTGDAADDIIAEIDKVEFFTSFMGEDTTNIRNVPEELVTQYLEEVKRSGFGDAKGIKIVYTPLNGCGYKLVPKILDMIGAEYTFVEEQRLPNGRFPTCPYPNPEKPEALRLGIEKCKKTDADLLIATDPDSDRIGVAVRHQDEYILLTGNEMGVLLTDYMFAMRKELGTLPLNPVIIRTVVSTSMVDKIAAEYGAEVKVVLTGFKYIGALIGELEKQGRKDDFIIGFEESYGYLTTTFVRDKDAVAASMLAAEMTAYYARKGQTLFDRLNELYGKFGKYAYVSKSYEFDGASGSRIITRIMQTLRVMKPDSIGGKKVIGIKDYLPGIDGLPSSDVLKYDLEGGATLVARPSGTEALIKFYIGVAGNDYSNARDLKSISEQIEKIISQISPS